MKKVYEIALHVTAFRSILSPPTRTHIMSNSQKLLESAFNILRDGVTTKNGECDTVSDWMQDYTHYISQSKRSAVIDSCQDWINAGMGDECFWEEWDECPTEIQLTPKMIIDAINDN